MILVRRIHILEESDDEVHCNKVRNMYYDDYVPSGFVQSAGIEKTDVDVLQEEFPSVPPEKIQKIYIDSGRDIAKSREMLVFETL